MHRPSPQDLIARFHNTWTDESSELTPIECGHAVYEILTKARQLLLDITANNDHTATNATNCNALLQTSDILTDYAYEKLHAFPYRQVPACWRELYTDACLLHAFAMWLQLSSESNDLNVEQGKKEADVETRRQTIHVLDKALVLAAGCGPGRRMLIMEVIEALENEIDENCQLAKDSSQPPSKKLKMDMTLSVRLGEDEEQDSSQLPNIKFPIPRLHQPSLEAFARHVHQQHPTPLIITGAMEHWPALQKWTDLDTLCKAAGPDRLVPIEIGSQYTDDNWTQKLITTREFIEQYIIGKSQADGNSDNSSHNDESSETSKGGENGSVGYLAQHDLFEQIPRLRRDIDIPDYCLIGPKEQGGYEPPDDTLLNAWFGPKGTVSPLHTDPYHNLLAQAVGRKYVRLYAPSQTRFLYSYGSKISCEEGSVPEAETETAEAVMLGNTSQVDAEHADLERYPLFAQAEYVETVLGPGEMLYIPFQWWHYIRSLSISFSVSFWF